MSSKQAKRDIFISRKRYWSRKTTLALSFNQQSVDIQSLHYTRQLSIRTNINSQMESLYGWTCLFPIARQTLHMGIPHWGHFQETLLQWRAIFHLLYLKHRPTSVNAHKTHSRVLFFAIHWGWPCNCYTSGFQPRLLHVQTRYKISISQCSCPSLGLGTPGYEMGEALFLQYGPPIRCKVCPHSF